MRTISHLPLTRGTAAFKVEFARPVRTGGNVFHLYLKADGDEKTGRGNAGVHTGVDYMFTLIDGNPNHESTRLDVWAPDGSAHRGSCTVVIRGEMLYLAGEMAFEQQDGHSVFEHYAMSYVKENGPNANLGYQRVASAGAPEVSAGGLLTNPDMMVVDGGVPGWHLGGGSRPLEAVAAAGTDGALVVDRLFSPEGLTQTVSLSPGHYLFRGLAKTNVFQLHLVAGAARIPIGVSDDYHWVELPFCVPLSEKNARVPTQVGVRYVPRPATGNASRLPARLQMKKAELVRLGDTALTPKWAQTIPADPLHRMKALQASPAWNRPGKVVFQDAFVGTELWLMTQEGKIDHSYVGHPDFSHEGKYLHIGARQAPRGLLRTDGTARTLNDRWSGLVWPFPWEQKRLPAGAGALDWIVTSRSTSAVQMLNAATGKTHAIEIPSRPGWRIVHYPGIAPYGGRGPNIQAIKHETLVWLSDDGKSIGRSNLRGEGFRAHPVKSVSAKPEADKLYESMSSVGGKGGDNWRDAVDRNGNRYHLFELNRDLFPDHATNPYQVWALCLTEGDARGLLRVTFHPAAKITEFVTTQMGMTPQPSANWWEFAAGFPWSGDNAILRLEDGTLVHMSSLGMHSAFFGGGSVTVNNAYTGEVGFIGNYPAFDRISWPHEFRRDRDYAVVASHAEPASPIVMLDLEHATLWTVALTNFHDYARRYQTRWNPTAYHKPMFRPAPMFSPDFTKVVYFSPMLTGDHPDRKWADVYVAVARYPEPPANLRRQGNALVWEKPQRHREVRAYNLYRSDASGRSYARVNREPLTATSYALPRGSAGFYVVTSVEYSGLESRVFSNEASVAGRGAFRHYYELEAGVLGKPMVPFFDPAGASGAYAVAVVDPELVYRKRLAEGLAGTATVRAVLPAAGKVRVLARVRGMSALERSTYTNGWPQAKDVARGRFTVTIGGRRVGEIPVEGPQWRWVGLSTGAVSLAAGSAEVKVATRDAGIAIDKILVTNDPAFVPRGLGQAPEVLAATPAGVRAAPFGPGDLRAAPELMKSQAPRGKLVWNPVTAPQGVAHYNVYRSDTKEFAAEPETQIGSPAGPVFYDCGFEAGQTVTYRVCAVDAWGNRSPASPAVAATAAAPPLQAAFRAVEAPGEDGTFTFDPPASTPLAGSINAWQWTFGDGAAAKGKSVTHAFARAGSYTVGLQIGSDREEWAGAEQMVVVRPAWMRRVREQGGVWVEAETFTGEGGGTSRRLAGRVGASGEVVSFWEQEAGHWLEWKVTAPAAGRYAVVLKYATGSPTAVRDCRIDGRHPGEPWQRQVFPGTGGFSLNEDNWSWRALQDAEGRPLRVELAAGPHTLRMANLGGGMALDVVLLTPSESLPPSR